MVFPMNQKEFGNWSETRKQGVKKYAFKTSLFSTIVVFLLYFVANAFVNLDQIDKYLEYNLAVADALAVALFLTFIALFVISKIFFVFNEKRYLETQNKDQGGQNNA